MAGLWKDPRTGTLTLRRRIPTRLRAAALASGHKGETVKFSTGVKDRKAAERALPDLLQRWNEKLAEWERLANVESLTPERAQHVAAQWAAWIASGAKLETGGVSASVFEPLTWAARPETYDRMLARVEFHTDEALRVAGIAITAETRGVLIEAMRNVVWMAYMQAEDDARRERRPDLYAGPLATARQRLPAVEGAPPAVMPAVSLRSLFDAWKAVATVKPRVVEETRYMVEMLAAFLDHDDAAKIARADLARWRDAMKAEGRSNNTWNNRLSMVRQVLAYGVAEGKLSADPTEGLRLRKSRNQSPQPYTDAEATRILTAARKEKRASVRWAHWVMAFTGMRAGEVLQLLGGDVRQEGDIWCIDVNENAAGKSVKTGQRRIVPIHPALIKEGFVTFAQTIGADAPLFADKLPDKHGNRGGRAWQVIGRWVRETVGITDTWKAPDHSWRHRVEDELRAVEAPEDVRDAILGHARKTTGRQYGVRGEALTRLHRFLSLIPAPRGMA